MTINSGILLVYEKEVMQLDNYGSVPVAVVARVYGKDACWVRAGIILGWLPIGIATRDNVVVNQLDHGKGRINFYISPKRLYEETGYIWKGERK